MTFRQLRHILQNQGPAPVRWNKSGIVEMANVTETGAINITNMVTRRVYKLRYTNIDVTVVGAHEMIAMGDLLPKGMRHEAREVTRDVK